MTLLRRSLIGRFLAGALASAFAFLPKSVTAEAHLIDQYKDRTDHVWLINWEMGGTFRATLVNKEEFKKTWNAIRRPVPDNPKSFVIRRGDHETLLSSAGIRSLTWRDHLRDVETLKKIRLEFEYTGGGCWSSCSDFHAWWNA